jgi:hypothetical protein
MCLLNLWPQYGNSFSYWNFFFFWKCLQTESLTNFMKIHSIIRRICKIVKSNYYLHGVCLLWMTQLPFSGLFMTSFWKVCWENSSFIKVRREWRVLYVKTNVHFWSYLTQFLEWEIFRTKVVKKLKIYILFEITVLFFKKHAIDEIMWKNIVELDRSQLTVWRVRIACGYLRLQTQNFGICEIIAFLLQQCLHKCTSVLRDTFFACLVVKIK